MSWKRTKTAITKLPAEPSFVRWLLVGLVFSVVGGLLFIIHASGMVKAMILLDIWWVTFSPIIVWFSLLCIRGWLWGRQMSEYNFLQKEAESAQLRWESWAGRHLAVLGSCILLPSGVTANAITKSGDVKSGQYISLSSHFDDDVATDAYLIKTALVGIQQAVRRLQNSLPLNVTLLTDCISPDLESQFNLAWVGLYPERSVPALVTVCEKLSFTWIEDRLTASVLDIDLILVLLKNGNEQYSDALAALLLTSDDVAEKYQLPNHACILRPMQLDMASFRDDMSLFLETQTVANQTARVFCDNRFWNEKFADVMMVALAHQTPWQPEKIDVLEIYNGIPGAASAWLLTALVSDMVTISNTPILGLFTSGNDHFVSAIIPGSENNDVG